jgi:hypothetical protein
MGGAMRVVSSIDYSIIDDGDKISYMLNEAFTYHSERYGKDVTCFPGMLSDGATGAFDISSRSWWVHDKLCDTGLFDDGTKCSNWQASQILQDILVEESPHGFWQKATSGRWWQSRYWFWATLVGGGGEARKNGMFSAAMILLMLSLSGCAYNSTTITAQGDVYCTASVDKPVQVNTSPSITAEGNTVPVSALP